MMVNGNIKNYTELSKLLTFEERFEYLKLSGMVGVETFGFDKYLRNRFLKTPEWKKVRNEIIIRDQGCDLGIDDRIITGKILIHHMNPMNPEDIVNRIEYLLNPEYLIATSLLTHNAIHYGDEKLLIRSPTERMPNDTCPWKH